MIDADEQTPQTRPAALLDTLRTVVPGDEGESVPLFIRLQRGASGEDASSAQATSNPDLRTGDDRRQGERRVADGSPPPGSAERRVGNLMERRLGDRRTNIWTGFRPEGTLPGWLDAVATPPAEAQLAAGLPNLHGPLSLDRRQQLVEKVFAGDVGTYRLAMFELSRFPTWQAAVEYLDYRIYQRFDVDPYGDDAKQFTQMVLDRYH